MKKNILQFLLLLSGSLLFLLTACKEQSIQADQVPIDNEHPYSEMRKNTEKQKDKATHTTSQQEKDNNSLTDDTNSSEPETPPQASGSQDVKPDNSQNIESEHNEDTTAENASCEQKTREIPSGWINGNSKTAMPESQLKLWQNVTAAIKRLIFAREVFFAPLGSDSTIFEKYSDSQYKISGRCIVIKQNGEKIAYTFKGTAFVNSYEANIQNIQFIEP